MYVYFKKIKVKFDYKFAAATMSWVILFAIVRVMEDARVYPKDFFWVITPGIYFLAVFCVLGFYFLAQKLEEYKKIEAWKTMIFIAVLGMGLNLVRLRHISILNWGGLWMVLGIWGMILLGMWALANFVDIPKLAYWAMGTHFLDASATFVSVQFFNYGEKHFLPSLLIDMFGAWVMFPLKIVFIIPVLYVIWKYSDDKPLRNYLATIVMILGLAPGFRDLLRLAMGV